MTRMFNPPHPGLVVREYLGVSLCRPRQNTSASRRVTLSRLLNGKAGISADMALRLSDALGTTPELWMGMQAQYDLWTASRSRRKKIAPLRKANLAKSA